MRMQTRHRGAVAILLCLAALTAHAATPTTTTLSSSASSAKPRNTVTLTAHVSGSGATAPTGTVTFFEATTMASADVALSSSGDATWTATPPVDHGSYTATYNGDAVYAQSVSSAVRVDVPPMYPSMSVSPAVVNLGDTDYNYWSSHSSVGGSVTVTNNGPEDLIIKSLGVTLNQPNPATFSNAPNTCATLPTHASCVITFDVTIPGWFWSWSPISGTLNIVSNGAATTTSIPFRNNAAKPDNPILAWAPTSVQVGQATTLLLGGTDFTPQTQVSWNRGAARAVTYISPTQLKLTLNANDVPLQTTYDVRVAGSVTGSTVTAVPPAPYPLPGTGREYAVPHVVSGAGFSTILSLVNLTDQPNGVLLNFLSQQGTLLDSKTYMIAPGGTLRVTTPPEERMGASNTRWAGIDSTGSLSVNVFFEYSDAVGNVLSSVGFDSPRLAQKFSFAIDHEAAGPGVSARTVGLAIANPRGNPATATVTLQDATGKSLASQDFSIPAYGQTAMDLDQIAAFHTAFPPGRFMGQIMVSSSSLLSAIVVGDDQRPFYSIRPVVRP